MLENGQCTGPWDEEINIAASVRNSYRSIRKKTTDKIENRAKDLKRRFTEELSKWPITLKGA